MYRLIGSRSAALAPAPPPAPAALAAPSLNSRSRSPATAAAERDDAISNQLALAGAYSRSRPAVRAPSFTEFRKWIMDGRVGEDQQMAELPVSNAHHRLVGLLFFSDTRGCKV